MDRRMENEIGLISYRNGEDKIPETFHAVAITKII